MNLETARSILFVVCLSTFCGNFYGFEKCLSFIKWHLVICFLLKNKNKLINKINKNGFYENNNNNNNNNLKECIFINILF